MTTTLAAMRIRSGPRVRISSLAWAILLLPLVLGVWSALDVIWSYSPGPLNDHIITMLQWRDIVTRGLRFEDLFSQHNEHRIFFPRLIFFADLAWFHGTNVLNFTAIGVIQLLAAAFYARVADVRSLRPIGVLGLAVAVSLIFSLRQWENFFWAFQVQFVGVQAAACWALYFFCRANAEDGPRPGLLIPAMLLLTVATFTLSSGVMAGAAMAMTALVARRGLKTAAVALVTTAALLAIYLHGYHPITIHAPPGLALQHPVRFAFYVLTYLGNGWDLNNLFQATFAGLVGACATAAMAVVVWRDRGRDANRTALFGMALFIGITAALTSFGRLNFGIEQSLSSRYVTPTSHFWASQAVFWALTVQRSRAPWPQAVVALPLLAAAVMLVPMQASMEAQLLGRQESIRLGDSALLAGLDDPLALKGVYPDPTVPQDVGPFLRKQRLSLFAGAPLPAVGSRFAPRTSGADITACRGAFDGLTTEPADPSAVRAFGWGWDLGARRPFEHVVLVDDSQRVLGVGLSGVLRRDVSKTVRQVKRPTAGWIAAAVRGQGREVIAYGLLADGRACELGRKAWPQ